MTRVYEMERNCVDCIRTYMHRVYIIYIYIYIYTHYKLVAISSNCLFSSRGGQVFLKNAKKRISRMIETSMLRSRSNNGDRGFAVVSRSKRRIGRNKSRNNSIEQSCLGNWIITGEEYK